VAGGGPRAAHRERRGADAQASAGIALLLSGAILPKPLRLPTNEECSEIARAANNHPRAAKQLLTALRDLGTVSEDHDYRVADQDRLNELGGLKRTEHR
jgi:hypothetical protein